MLPNTLFRPPLFAWITLLAISAVVMWPSWHAMVDIWRTSETFSHGWLIFPIFIWLAFKRRDVLQPVTPKPALFVSCFLAAFSLLWIFSQLVSVKVTDQFALVGIVACSFWLFFGNRVAKLMLFPLVFLFAMVPAGEGLNPILMEKTANATIWALQITGIPVYREGMNFRLPTGSWSVVEACSGLRYVIAAFILSVLFANLNYSSWRKRIGFVAICMVSAILANWVRAYTVVLVGHFSEMRYGTGEDHVWYGWIFFGVLMFGIFWAGAKYSDQGLEPTPPPPALPTQIAKSNLSFIVAFALASLIVFPAPWFAKVLQDRAGDQIHKPFELVQVKASKQGSAEPKPFIIKQGFSGGKNIEGNLGGLRFSIIEFSNQHRASDMLAFGNRFFPETGADFVLTGAEPRLTSISLDYGQAKPAVLRSQGNNFEIYTFYVVDNQTTGSAYLAKALRLRAVLFGRSDQSRAVYIAVPKEMLDDAQISPAVEQLKQALSKG